MTYESVENRVRQNCRNLKIAITPNCRKWKIEVRQKCRKLVWCCKTALLLKKIMIRNTLT
jgi:hypothetical protein